MPGETSVSVRSVGPESRQSSLRSCGAQPDIQSEPFGACLYPSNSHYECGVTQDITPARVVFPVPSVQESRSPGASSVGAEKVPDVVPTASDPLGIGCGEAVRQSRSGTCAVKHSSADGLGSTPIRALFMVGQKGKTCLQRGGRIDECAAAFRPSRQRGLGTCPSRQSSTRASHQFDRRGPLV